MRGNHQRQPPQIAHQRRKVVYPRVCGGTGPERTAMPGVAGLSPRMRGNQVGRQLRKRFIGSIPAYAGEPPSIFSPVGRNTVYPRVCGGTFSYSTRRRMTIGLSPRMRGNPLRLGRSRQPGRSIPAYAGEPVVMAAVISFLRVYPRVCGGTSRRCIKGSMGRGLSPRMRGNLAL